MVERLTRELLGEMGPEQSYTVLAKFRTVCDWRRILRVEVQQVYSFTFLFQSQVCVGKEEENEDNFSAVAVVSEGHW